MTAKNEKSVLENPPAGSKVSTNQTNSSAEPLASNASMPVQQDTGYKEALADPVYAGFGTWLGTIISIVAAFVAWRQAKQAKSIVEKVGTEQQRSTISATAIHLNNLENHLLPLWEFPRKRGIKISRIISDAKYECHRALSDLSEKRDGEIRKAIQSIEAQLDEYLTTKEGEPTDAALNSAVRRELQDVTSSCKYILDGFANSK